VAHSHATQLIICGMTHLSVIWYIADPPTRGTWTKYNAVIQGKALLDSFFGSADTNHHEQAFFPFVQPPTSSVNPHTKSQAESRTVPHYQVERERERERERSSSGDRCLALNQGTSLWADIGYLLVYKCICVFTWWDNEVGRCFRSFPFLVGKLQTWYDA